MAAVITPQNVVLPTTSASEGANAVAQSTQEADTGRDASIFTRDRSPTGENLSVALATLFKLTAPKRPQVGNIWTIGVPPSATGLPEDVLKSIASKILHAPLSEARKAELLEAFHALRGNFATVGPQLPRVLIMEGATGLPEGKGRQSTDPDENMSLKAIAFRSLMLNEATVIAVPDAGNQEHTRAFLARLGARVAPYVSGEPLVAGVTYVARMDDRQQMKDVLRVTPEGREVLLLGPGVYHAVELLNERTVVTPMGSVVMQDGELKLSTNFRDCSKEFFEKARPLCTQMYLSSAMKSFSVSLHEVMLESDLLTPADILHWANNSKGQFLGIVDGHHNLLAKRLDNADLELQKLGCEAGGLFKGVSFNWPAKGEGLVFLPFLEKTGQATVNAAALETACESLGAGFSYLLSEDGATQAKEELIALVTAHRGTPEFEAHVEGKEEKRTRYGIDTQKCIELIEGMDGVNARHAFASLALAFKDIYDEKAAPGAWHASATPGKQCVADNFVSAYLGMPGKQIPYDAIVALISVLGDPATKEEQRLFADTLLLIFWSGLFSCSS